MCIKSEASKYGSCGIVMLQISKKVIAITLVITLAPICGELCQSTRGRQLHALSNCMLHGLIAGEKLSRSTNLTFDFELL